MRVTMIAVNIDVAIPIIKVTEKPLIGPVPMANRINAAIKVVMLASRIVAKQIQTPKHNKP